MILEYCATILRGAIKIILFLHLHGTRMLGIPFEMVNGVLKFSKYRSLESAWNLKRTMESRVTFILLCTIDSIEGCYFYHLMRLNYSITLPLWVVFGVVFFSVYHLSEVALSSGLVTAHINGEIAVSECLNLSSGQMFHEGALRNDV